MPFIRNVWRPYLKYSLLGHSKPLIMILDCHFYSYCWFLYLLLVSSGKASHAAAQAKTKVKQLWHQIETFCINLWNWSMAHKTIAIPIFVAAVILLIVMLSCCCYCCCRKKGKNKKKEKLKMKGIKPSKFLMRIQPGKRAKHIMVNFCYSYIQNNSV